MDRRSFVRNAATGAAGVALGGVAGAAHVRRDLRTCDNPEGLDFGGIGRGEARLVWSVETSEKLVALTCDDGPHPRLTPAMLDVLADHGVPATFFLIGAAAERHPSLVRRIAAEGHEIANHSATHASVAHLDRDAARAEVLDGAAAIERITGEPQRWYRAPRGMLNGAVLRAAADLGQDVAMWSCRVRLAPPETAPEAMAAQLSADLHPGAILLLHDGTSGREDEGDLEARRQRELPALDAFLDDLDARGYRCVTVSELARHADQASA